MAKAEDLDIVNILAIDDEDVILDTLRFYFRKEKKYNLITGKSGEEGMEILSRRRVDLVIADMKMTGMDGLEVIERVKSFYPDIPVIILSGISDIPLVVSAIKKGAVDYLTKPVEKELLFHSLEKVREQKLLREEVKRLKEEAESRFSFAGIVGRSPGIQKVFQQIRNLSDTDATVLIRGETGTGKDMVAKALHQNSPRRDFPFVKIDCTVLSETLLESELFGHEKGAFTGAMKKKEGKFELAHRGTVFLDEIGNISPGIQAKLLRFLQEREFERVGGVQTVKVDVRIISATNSNLEEDIKQGKFREDLYYRLNVFPLFIPPLRERKEDIPLLTVHFLKIYNNRFNRSVETLSPEALDLLMKHPWSGNIRELENVIERAVIVGRGTVLERKDLESLGTSLTEDEDSLQEEDIFYARIPLVTPYSQAREMIMESLDRKYLDCYMRETGGSINRTAELMNLSPRSIYEKMKNFNMDKNRYKNNF